MRLIDADALNIQDIFCSYDTVTDLIDVEVWLDHAPTIDAVPVVHGRWYCSYREVVGGLYLTIRECACCGWTYDREVEYNYCPNCGARIDGDE